LRASRRDGFNAKDEAIAAEIRQELEAARQAANIEPVAPEIEVLPEYDEIAAEPEPAFAGEVLPVAAAPMADVLPPQEGVAPALVASPPEIEELPQFDELAAEPEPAFAEDMLPVAVAPMAEVPPPQDDVAPSPVVSLPPAPSAPVPDSSRREVPQDPLAEVRDDVDAQVLPIFLEEAAELYPHAGEQVRAWRRSPGDAGWRGGCAGRCIPSRAARAWPGPCAWANSRT
jgi:chemosensory pili system protein ChpA (sensor histidine kinase/response regulator)